MITEHRAKQLVSKHLVPTAEKFGLHSWDIEVDLNPILEQLGQVEIRPECYWARITMNHAALDEEGFKSVLKHEVLHILLHPLEQL